MRVFFIGLMLLLIRFLATAQINYTDINPDIVLDGSDTCFLDINADGIDDIKFTQEDSISALNANGIGVTLLHYDVEFIGDHPSYDPGHLYPFRVDSNNVIDSTANGRQWVTKFGANDVVRVMHIHFFGGADIGEWAPNLANSYLGFRIKIATKWHYAWVRVGAPNLDASQLIVKDYAINMQQNEKIYAGQKQDFGPSAVAISYEDSLCGTVLGFVRRNTSNTLLYNIVYAKNSNGGFDSIAFVPAAQRAIFIDRDTNLLYAQKTYKVSAVDSHKGESLLSDSAQSGHLRVTYFSYSSANLVYNHFSGLPIENYLYFYRTHSSFYTSPFDSILKANTALYDTISWSGPCRNYIASSVLNAPIYIVGYGIMDTLRSNPASSCFHNLIYPEAKFSALIPVGGSLPTSINFHDKSETSIKEWLWNFGDGDTSTLQNPVHVYTSSGYYAVSLRVSNCFGEDSITKTCAISVGLNSIKQDLSVKLYPNPARNYIMIELTKDCKMHSVKMYDPIGNQVFVKESINQSSVKINLLDKSSGIYFMDITTDKGIVNRKVIIE